MSTQTAQTFTHPSQLTDAQRREATAQIHDRMANAMLRAGGISAKRDAPVAKAAARKLREKSARSMTSLPDASTTR